jgi:hypothetical protein
MAALIAAGILILYISLFDIGSSLEAAKAQRVP